MENKYKFQAACQIERMATRADFTIKMTIGLQELSDEREAAVMALRKVPVNILISPQEITQEDLESVDIISEEDKEHFGRKAKTKSQRLRDILYRVWESEGSKGTSKEYYANEMDKISDHYIEKYLQD